MGMSRRGLSKQCVECPVHAERACVLRDAVKLSAYQPGQKGRVLQVCGNPDFRLRMLEMGFVKGTEIEVVKSAPLYDPIEFVVKGYHVSLRRVEASEILMDQPEIAA
jgi:Fe2+ transport system protein FeoA